MSPVFKYDDYPVIVGIDFGTTYSGCSYAFTHGGDDVIDILKWPRKLNSVYPKTPTVALYSTGSKAPPEWGYSAQRAGTRPGNKNVLVSKFKLHLDENLRHKPLPNNLDALDVITDYLRMFHEHVCGELSKSFAVNYTQDRYRYCLTVPAMWSDRAKALMREAATRAGLIRRGDHPERLMLISEPEAAALYCEKKAKQFNLTAGQRFLICDAGGGTVDLIVFEIEINSDGGRTLKEVTRGHGGLCGSGFIDMKMRDYLMGRLSGLGKVSGSAMESLMDIFVNIIKPAFDGIDDQYIDLPASVGAGIDNPAMDIFDGQMHLRAQDLREHVFEPVVAQVLQLVEQQLIQAPQLEAMFLVGGFGQSHYLFNRVKECFEGRVGMIAVPPRGELAVVRGAVYLGLNPKVITERVSRRTYGVECRMLYMDGIDPIEYSCMDLDGRVYCRNCFSPYVRKGERIKVDECYVKPFSITYPMNTDSDLYAYDGDDVPPRHVTHPLIKKVGTFPIKMPHIPGLYPGERVDLSIRMYFGLTEVKIETIIRDKTFVFTSAFDAAMMAVTSRSDPQAIHRHLSNPAFEKKTYYYAPERQLPVSRSNDQSSYPKNNVSIYDDPDNHPLGLHNSRKQIYGTVKPHKPIDCNDVVKQRNISVKPQASIRYRIPNEYHSTPILEDAALEAPNPAVHIDRPTSTSNYNLEEYPNNTGQKPALYFQLQQKKVYQLQPVQRKQEPLQQELDQYSHSRFHSTHSHPKKETYDDDFPPSPPPSYFTAVKPDAFD